MFASDGVTSCCRCANAQRRTIELSADELWDELARRYIEAKALSKVEMQKALINALSQVAPVVTQQVSPRTDLSLQQQLESEVMKLSMQPEALEKKARIEAEALEKK